jgi:tetratricopeptide (TPR) repeat protein
MEDDDYPSSDNDSFKSFDSDSPASSKDQKSAPQVQPQPSSKSVTSGPKDANPTTKSTSTDPNPSISKENQPPTQPPTKPTTTTKPTTSLQPPDPSARFPPEEEASLLAESNDLKLSANTLFGKGSYENAIQTYDRALALCPNYLDYEIAVLRSNISACHLKLSDWKEASEASAKGIECLERLERLPVVRAPERRKDGKSGKDGQEEGKAAEVVEEVDEDLEARIENLRLSGHTIAQVRKLQVKLLMRRAKAKTELAGWSNLQAADEDYRVLLSPTMEPALSPTDKKSVMDSTRALGPKLNSAKEQEMAEMMGKLKGLGNSFLKPFGLSTENFKFEQDAKTGGYSMNFDQGAGKK